MVMHGQQHPERTDTRPELVAARTLQTLMRTIPPSMGGVNFLSGGQSELEASKNLNAMNTCEEKPAWNLSFSYGRAMQNSCVNTWGGKEENVKAAQEALLGRAKANSEASKGSFVDVDLEPGMWSVDEKLVIDDYAY